MEWETQSALTLSTRCLSQLPLPPADAPFQPLRQRSPRLRRDTSSALPYKVAQNNTMFEREKAGNCTLAFLVLTPSCSRNLYYEMRLFRFKTLSALPPALESNSIFLGKRC